MKIAHIGIVFAIILVASIYFIFFAKKEGTPGATTTTVPGTTTTTGVIGRIIAVNEVSIFADRFEPNQIKIKTDEKVKWINRDSKEHEVVCVDAAQNLLFDAVLNAGESWEFYTGGAAECWDPSVGEGTMSMSITV